MAKKRSINLQFDPKKPIDRVNTMNALAEVCRILHTDPDVGTLSIQILGAGKDGLKAKHTFEFKIK